MKIGVLTLPLHTNYGGILQAYALQQVLKRMGHEAVLLDRKRFSLPPWHLRPLKYGKRIINKYIFGKHISVFAEKHKIKEQNIKQRFTKEFVCDNIERLIFKSYDKIKAKDYDCLIVGSDQVWRPKYANYLLNGIEHSYLDFAELWKVRRVAYAASFGTNDWEYTDKEAEDCKRLLKKFDYVSVREKDGINLCQKHFGIDAKLLLDPTLLLEKKDYIKLFEKKQTPPSSGNLMVYVLDRNQDTDHFITQYANSQGLVPFYTNTQVDNGQIDINERVQPPLEKWLRGFYDADFIITDSFHACLFSILFNKNFVVLGNATRGLSRFDSLLSMFGLEDRMISDLESAIALPYIEYSKVNEKVREMRDISISFLKDALH